MINKENNKGRHSLLTSTSTFTNVSMKARKASYKHTHVHTENNVSVYVFVCNNIMPKEVINGSSWKEKSRNDINRVKSLMKFSK